MTDTTTALPVQPRRPSTIQWWSWPTTRAAAAGGRSPRGVRAGLNQGALAPSLELLVHRLLLVCPGLQELIEELLRRIEAHQNLEQTSDLPAEGKA